MGVGSLTILLGMSASGKDTILQELVKRGYKAAVSHTTRPKRDSEIDGIDYYFISEEEFDKIDDFVSVRVFSTFDKDGNPATWKYGLSKSSLETEDDFVTIVDYKGLIQLKSKQISLCSIFIRANSEIRFQRAMERGNLSLVEWQRREAFDAANFGKLELINAIVDNDNLPLIEVVDKVERIIKLAKSLKGDW